MNENENIKDAIESIKPEPYMKTRIKANVLSSKKVKPSVWKKAGAAFLALALLCSAGGIFAGSNHADDKITTQQNAPITSNIRTLDFSIVAYADENGEKINPIKLDEKNITASNLTIKIYKDNDEHWAVETNATQGFDIHSKNIDEVIFKSENGEFIYTDSQLIEYELGKDDYYSAKIPLTDEQTKDYLENYNPSAKEYAKKLLAEKDYSKYFMDNKILSLDEYSIDFSDKEDMDNENQLLFREKSNIKKYVHFEKTITAKTYVDDSTINEVYYHPDNAIDYLLENPNTKLNELPGDTISITVKYKDGQSLTKKIQTSFNDKGYMQFEYIK